MMELKSLRMKMKGYQVLQQNPSHFKQLISDGSTKSSGYYQQNSFMMELKSLRMKMKGYQVLPYKMLLAI
jgi:hypothetical protein